MNWMQRKLEVAREVNAQLEKELQESERDRWALRILAALGWATVVMILWLQY